MDQIIVDNVSKTIKGRVVLDHVSVTVDRGGIYGFVGVNGSGKTMLFRAICGLIKLDEGSVSVFGQKIGAEEKFPQNLGVIIENVGFWGEYTGFQNLKLLASICRRISDAQIREAIQRVGLDPDDKRNYQKYSLGMKQRLGIAQAIMEQPELLVLDEPTNALDDDGVALVHTILQEEHQRGATILLASHNKADIDSLCSRKFKMAEGRIREITETEEPS